jgi:outer membrane murein-binding lipoprotein Lpp
MDLSNIILGVAAFLGAFFLKNLSKNIEEITISVKDLNNKVAVIIERTETHGQEIQILREKHDNIASDVAHIKAHIKK